jgi:hypothetical protein
MSSPNFSTAQSEKTNVSQMDANKLVAGGQD